MYEVAMTRVELMGVVLRLNLGMSVAQVIKFMSNIRYSGIIAWISFIG